MDGQLALVRHVSMPMLLAAVSGWVLGPVAGTAALTGGLAYSVWAWKTRKKIGGAVLRIDEGVLVVTRSSKSARDDRFRLDDLADVALDIKTIQRVMEGGSAIPAVRFIDATVGPKVDTARIVLVSQSGVEVRLTDEYLPHFAAAEWMGKIRVFLRKSGWVPEDEREEPGVGHEEP
jgi:hypothetical protein